MNPIASDSMAPAFYWKTYIKSGAVTGEETFNADVDLEYVTPVRGTSYWPSGVVCETGGLLKLKDKEGDEAPIRAVAGCVYPLAGITELTFSGTAADGITFLYNDDR